MSAPVKRLIEIRSYALKPGSAAAGARDAIVSRIESYLNTVLWLSEESIADLRRLNAADKG